MPLLQRNYNNIVIIRHTYLYVNLFYDSMMQLSGLYGAKYATQAWADSRLFQPRTTVIGAVLLLIPPGFGIVVGNSEIVSPAKNSSLARA